MPQLDFATYPPQLVWLAITFTVMFIIMWKVAVPKISDALEARQMRLEENLKKAEDLKREAEATLAAYENALAEARAEAHNQIVKIQADLQEAAAKEEEELNEKLDAKLAESERAIAAEVEKAMESVRDVAVDIASAAVERLSGGAQDKAAVEKAVDSAINGKA